MANKALFQRLFGSAIPKAHATNFEFAPAYKLSPKQTLAQYAATACFNNTFYADAGLQLKGVLEACTAVEPEFIARTAVFARQHSFMKDMPALLCAVLASRDLPLHESVFEKVVDDTKMLRNYVQILRSGVAGRRSLGTAPKRLIRRWLERRNEESLFRSSTGATPSLGDVLKMVHPKPGSASREAFYGYMLGRRHNAEALPVLVREFERFKSGEAMDVPDLPFMMLSSLPLSQRDWATIASKASWQTLRMNLNTFARHGVFNEPGMAELAAKRLRDAAEIERSRVLPYQLLSAFKNCDADVPAVVREALQDAMEIATSAVPAIDGTVFICPDVSGSMADPITGRRKGATSQVRCIDVAALVAAAFVRKNPTAEVKPFQDSVVHIDLNPRDTVMTNAEKLAAIGGGGTSCSAPLADWNARGAKADLVVIISDNQSWVDASLGNGTAVMVEWQKFRRRNPNAKLVCVDIHPYVTTQAVEREDILNIGGFSDHVFEVIAQFASGRLRADHWVGLIEQIDL
jgi:60 kDa SS-A/Ro ribonucleoprotein